MPPAWFKTGVQVIFRTFVPICPRSAFAPVNPGMEQARYGIAASKYH
jgi:hypothetical protein